MWTSALYIVLYEAAIRTLQKVCLLSNPGVIGFVIKETDDNRTLVHWGVSDKKVVQSWHLSKDLHTWPFGVMMDGYTGDPANY